MGLKNAAELCGCAEGHRFGFACCCFAAAVGARQATWRQNPGEKSSIRNRMLPRLSSDYAINSPALTERCPPAREHARPGTEGAARSGVTRDVRGLFKTLPSSLRSRGLCLGAGHFQTGRRRRLLIQKRSGAWKFRGNPPDQAALSWACGAELPSRTRRTLSSNVSVEIGLLKIVTFARA